MSWILSFCKLVALCTSVGIAAGISPWVCFWSKEHVRLELTMYRQENELYEILWYFEIKMDNSIQTRRWNFIIVNKRKRICQLLDFTIPADNRVVLKRKANTWIKYLDLARELKKLYNECDSDTNQSEPLQQSLKNLEKRLGELEIQRRFETVQTIEIGRNAEKSPGELRWCCDSDFSEDHQ